MKFYTIDPKPHLRLRIIATLIDYGIYFIFYGIYLYVFDENPEPGRATVTGLMVLPIVIVWFLYFVVLESSHATPGHDIVKLKVVTDGAAKPSLSATFKRRLLDPIDIFIYCIPALICVLKTPKHQRLGDLWANTLVVKATDITEGSDVLAPLAACSVPLKWNKWNKRNNIDNEQVNTDKILSVVKVKLHDYSLISTYTIGY